LVKDKQTARTEHPRDVVDTPDQSRSARSTDQHGIDQPHHDLDTSHQALATQASICAFAEEPQYINNAGLILIWPYLTRFFDQVGLLEAKSFRFEASRERAVLLLQHLVTGESQWPEHQLLLNKVLCGWPIGDPVNQSITLTDCERTESDQLLCSIIENWKMLKHTSIGGLRSSFLQRQGRLIQQDQGWQLTVARVGYDVLLDSLTWGIGLVLLPWMKQPVFVEW
jgi:hypothetical protein